MTSKVVSVVSCSSIRCWIASQAVDDLGDLRRSVTPVVTQDNDNALILRQLGEHVPKLTRITGQASGWFWWVHCHHPAPSQCRSTSADNDASQVRAGLVDLIQPSRYLDETVLNKILSFRVAPHEGERESNHAGVLRLVQAFEHTGIFCNRLGRGSHFPHHLLRRTKTGKCCTPPQILFGCERRSRQIRTRGIGPDAPHAPLWMADREHPTTTQPPVRVASNRAKVA